MQTRGMYDARYRYAVHVPRQTRLPEMQVEPGLKQFFKTGWVPKDASEMASKYSEWDILGVIFFAILVGAGILGLLLVLTLAALRSALPAPAAETAIVEETVIVEEMRVGGTAAVMDKPGNDVDAMCAQPVDPRIHALPEMLSGPIRRNAFP